MLGVDGVEELDDEGSGALGDADSDPGEALEDQAVGLAGVEDGEGSPPAMSCWRVYPVTVPGGSSSLSMRMSAWPAVR
ncbi:hypothetical protein D3C59_35970 [Streptomyces sp. SHP22-7]|nr:hypothetical protein D3C59_35970 [Streptomyces sp. SHP22-7]